MIKNLEEKIENVLLERYGILVKNISRSEVGDVSQVFFTDDYVVKVKNSEELNFGGMSFWHGLQNDNIVKVPELVKTFNGSIYMFDEDKAYIVSERIDRVSREVTPERCVRMGQMLRKLHGYGREKEREDELVKYQYLDGFEKLESLEVRDELEPLKESTLDFRKEVVDDVQTRITNIPYDKYDVFLQHCDFQLENLIFAEDGIYLTDFDFVSLGYSANEVVRMMIELIDETGELEYVENFFDAYSDKEKSFSWYEGMMRIYLKYLLFNCFPLYMNNLSKDRIETVLDQRENRINVLLDNWTDFEDIIGRCQNGR